MLFIDFVSLNYDRNIGFDITFLIIP